VKTNGGWNGEVASGNPVWGSTQRNTKNVTLTPLKIQNNIMPNVIGMGARDAVFLLESKGLKVKLNGRGKVTAQSISYGNTIVAGSTCTLSLN
jgi:cell division protein FtsI (penicillin-binding protein 3)